MLKHIQFLSLITMGCLVPAMGASVSIGVIRSSGEFRVDGSLIRGNGTLFDGTVVETSRESSELELADGARVTLAPGSRATVYHDRTTLETGVGTARNSHMRAVNVRDFSVSSQIPDGVLQVAVNSSDQVVVRARVGAAEVRTSSGLLVAHVLPGTALAFHPQAGATATSVTLNGCLVGQRGAFLLTDSTSNVTVEVQGLNLAKYAGSRVEVTGSVRPGVPPVEGADQLIRAAKVTSLGPCAGKSGTAPSGLGGAGSSRGAGNAGSSAGGIGLSPVTTVAIIGGVAVGGTFGGLAAAGTFSGTAPASPQ